MDFQHYLISSSTGVSLFRRVLERIREVVWDLKHVRLVPSPFLKHAFSLKALWAIPLISQSHTVMWFLIRDETKEEVKPLLWLQALPPSFPTRTWEATGPSQVLCFLLCSKCWRGSSTRERALPHPQHLALNTLLLNERCYHPKRHSRGQKGTHHRENVGHRTDDSMSRF